MRIKLSTKGQITIPKTLRTQLKLEIGDQIECYINMNGAITLQPLNVSVADLFGCLGRFKKSKKHMTIKEMDQGIADAVREKFERIKKEA